MEYWSKLVLTGCGCWLPIFRPKDWTGPDLQTISVGHVLYENWLSREVDRLSIPLGARGRECGRLPLGAAKFVDWEEFMTEFEKEFTLAHADTVAMNCLE